MSERSTAPYWMQAVDAVVDAGMIPVRLPGGLVGARFPTAQESHWAATMTPDQRGELVRTCIRLKRLVQDTPGDSPRELWQAAHDTLREMMEYINEHGEQS